MQKLTLFISSGLLAFSYPVASRASAFVPLHTYYMAPNGNDSNNGLSVKTAWLTPNHSVKCGDVIYAQPGTYSGSAILWQVQGAVTQCPSTAGGIDGKGGVFFAQIICQTAFSCSAASPQPGLSAIKITASNWAVAGWNLTSANQDSGCGSINPVTATTIHHSAFINNICNGSYAQGFGSNPHSANKGSDYQAYVGNLAYNSAKGTDLCFSGLSVYDPVNYDTKAGTHIFIAGNVSWGNTHPACQSNNNTDGNGIILDDWGGDQMGQSAYSGTGVVKNNIAFDNYGSGISVGGNSTTSAPIKIYNNTLYGNSQNTLSGYGGIPSLFLVYVRGSAPVSVYNNIIHSNIFSYKASGAVNKGATEYVYALQAYASTSAAKVYANYIYNSASPNGYVYDNSPASPAFQVGQNTMADASLANPPAHNAIGAPNCSGSTLTTKCMAQVISRFASKRAPSYGYQPPSSSCVQDADYPTWLKGVVPDGLISKQCGM
jgi:hypothetical protein